MAKRQYLSRTGRVIERDDGFRETLAPTMPVYTHVEPIEAVPTATRSFGALELLVGWISGVVNALLAVRFVFSLLDVNQDNAIASFIYSTTSWLVTPFANLFNFHPNVGLGYFDLPAVIAIVAVSLVASILAGLLRIGRV